MYNQNPIFIPGPTNIPEVLRKAVRYRRRSTIAAAFAEILHPGAGRA
jgi:alanine-glyoxylate transaminase/serine-glyoxylate transaminase/serine-pyruvate transaminase